MMKSSLAIFFSLTLPSVTHAFTSSGRPTFVSAAGTQSLFSSWGEPEQHQWGEPEQWGEQQEQQQGYYDQGGLEEEEPTLILGGEEMQQQMQQLKSKYPTSEADYLAAARERAKNKPQSRNIAATVEDFQKVADEKRKTFGEFDDWEESAKEAGNLDSQILLPQLPDENEYDDGEGPEPTLLL
uniref:PS II complex 12 kDa extrinsic protein n=1 Tax=Amphora coffeiformis TaxID=265554 RepID=A0A7S3L8C5_9STRA|mmetsp:Transcript_7202/g.13765  ORF Transcript_7202/g.13765 Transcript_7202/m.13765 type:complete len:183 (-) Transcript_7202:37-585(-)|eukprot:scaffold9243_cov162-Amphora_coffeaeformis.AAC.2